jgi:hypothetical protein
MDKEIGIYEFEWWGVFISFSILLLVSVILVGIFVLGIQLVYYYGLSSHYSYFPYIDTKIIRVSLYLFFVFGLFCYSIGGLLIIGAVPKLIVFRQNSISISPALGPQRDYSYEDISRIVIGGITPFNVLMYFSDNKTRVMYNSNRIFNYQAINKMFYEKGLSRIIEVK